jgi:hypothetical protein
LAGYEAFNCGVPGMFEIGPEVGVLPYDGVRFELEANGFDAAAPLARDRALSGELFVFDFEANGFHHERPLGEVVDEQPTRPASMQATSVP